MTTFYTKKTRLRMGDVVLQKIDETTYVNTSDWTTVQIASTGYNCYPRHPYTPFGLIYLGCSIGGECLYGIPDGAVYLIVDEIFVPVQTQKQVRRSVSPGRERSRSRSRSRSRERSLDRLSAVGRDPSHLCERSLDRLSAAQKKELERDYTISDRRSLINLTLFLKNNVKNIHSIVWYTDIDGKYRVKNLTTGEAVDADMHFLLESQLSKRYAHTTGRESIKITAKEHVDRCRYFSYMKNFKKNGTCPINCIKYYAIFPYAIREYLQKKFTS